MHVITFIALNIILSCGTGGACWWKQIIYKCKNYSSTKFLKMDPKYSLHDVLWCGRWKFGSPKSTATHVTKICAKPVKKNISQIHQMYTNVFHLDFEDLSISVKNIYLKCVNVSVNNVIFLFVSIVLLKNTEAHMLMWWKNSRAKTMRYKMIYKK